MSETLNPVKRQLTSRCFAEVSYIVSRKLRRCILWLIPFLPPTHEPVAIALFILDVKPPVDMPVCRDGKVYRSTDGSTAVDGTGWLPFNFTLINSGSPFFELPIDPINNGKYFYSFACDVGLNFEFNAVLESESYKYLDAGDNPNAYGS